MLIITEIACVILEVIILYIFFKNAYNSPNKSKIITGISWLLFALILTMLSLTDDAEFIRLLFTFVSVALISSFIYNQKLLKSIITSVIFILFIAISDVFTTILLLNIGLSVLETNTMSHIVYLVFGHIIMLAVFFLLIALFPFSRTNYNPAIIIPIIPSLAVSLMLMLAITNDYIIKGKDIPGYYLLITIGLLYINVIFLLYAKALHEYANKRKEAELSNQHYEMQIKYYEQMHTHQEEVRALWHDMNKYINALHIDANTSSSELISHFNSITPIVDTNNSTINIILSDYVRMIKAIPADINLDIQIPDILSITTADLYIIIGNSIDNAISACQEPSLINPTIYLKLKYINNMLYYELTNPYSASEKTYDKPHLHGYGLKNIKKCVDKYQGTMLVNKDNNLFTLSIHLNLS